MRPRGSRSPSTLHGSQGSLSGRIRTVRGELELDIEVLAEALDPPFQDGEADIEWRLEGSELVGHWETEELIAGRYRVHVDPNDDRHNWTVSSVETVPPATGIEFLCDDRMGTSDLGFNVLDARSGRRILDYRSYWSDRGELVGGEATGEEAETASGCAVAVRGWPLDRVLDWTIVVPGYRPARGSVSDFTSVVRGPEGLLRCATVWMEPGFGFEIQVVADDDLTRTVEGAHVLVDGERVGRTDHEGRFRVDGRLDRSRIGVEYEGYVWRDGAWRDGVLGLDEWDDQPIWIWLSPNE